jgi:teichuronic acid biosynthesis glycosyltransferase TuaC
VRVLVADNMRPEEGAPQRGSFVRDQVTGLRRAGVEVEHASFPPGNRGRATALRGLRAALAERRFDLVHAHFGLTGWCAKLAGASPLVVTFHGTDVRHPATGIFTRRLVRRIALVAGASRALFAREAGRPALPLVSGRSAVLPCGADLERFRPLSRADARKRLGLDADGHYLLFPASPSRPVKRPDRARAVAERVGAELLVAGEIDPAAMPDWVNAADAVLVTSDNEGFGLPAVEALACEVPVLSTPVGVAPALLRGIEGCLCAPFEIDSWGGFLRAERERGERRVEGRGRAAGFSADSMAARALAAYRALVGSASGGRGGRG